MADNTPSSSSSSPSISLTLTYHGTPHTFTLPASSTISTLSDAIANTLSIPPSYQKLLISPKTGLLKPPFANPSLPLTTLLFKKILLLAPTASQLSALAQPTSHPTTNTTPPKKTPRATPTRTRDVQKTLNTATYTFHTLLPLAHLPSPHLSLAYLERLRSDPGILTTMATHKFSVGVLTEMDPAMHTTHSSRTLGLNRNRGEVIELRLRTDAGDGYRSYKSVRKTLCHELAHNVFGEHDGQFWRLTAEIEREVERGDWRGGGRRLTDEVFYEPPEEDLGEVDGGGWTGGEFVLGGGGGGRVGGDSGDGGGQDGGSGIGSSSITRREAMAKAAEERARKQKEAVTKGGDEAGGV